MSLNDILRRFSSIVRSFSMCYALHYEPDHKSKINIIEYKPMRRMFVLTVLL
jgi:hypothetical protein